MLPARIFPFLSKKGSGLPGLQTNSKPKTINKPANTIKTVVNIMVFAFRANNLTEKFSVSIE
jgi:hypothetical protein